MPLPVGDDLLHPVSQAQVRDAETFSRRTYQANCGLAPDQGRAEKFAQHSGLYQYDRQEI